MLTDNLETAISDWLQGMLLPDGTVLTIGPGWKALHQHAIANNHVVLCCAPKVPPPEAAIVFATTEELPHHRCCVVGISGDECRTDLLEAFAHDCIHPETLILAPANLSALLTELRCRRIDPIGPGLVCGSGSDFAAFMQERYVVGTWSFLAELEHIPRYHCAQTIAAGKRVLDVGCGTGYGTRILAERAASVTGIDISEDALFWARNHQKSSNLIFQRRDDFGAGLPPRSIDLITCFEMIEHVTVADQHTAMAAFASLISEEGIVMVSTPDPAMTRRYGANPYHLHEMEKSEFEVLCLRYFPHVRLLPQRLVAASLIGDGTAATTPCGTSVAWIALCSRVPIPAPTTLYASRELDLPQLILDVIRLRSERSALTMRMALALEPGPTRQHSASILLILDQLIARIAALDDNARRLEQLIIDKDAALNTQAEDIGRLEGICTDKQTIIARVQGELHHLYKENTPRTTWRSWIPWRCTVKDADLALQAMDIRRLEAVCIDKNTIVAELTREVDRLEHAVTDKDQAVATVVAEVQRLEVACTDKDAIVAELISEVDRLEHAFTDKDQAVATVVGEVQRLESVCRDKVAIVELLTIEIRRLESACSNKNVVGAPDNVEVGFRKAEQERIIARTLTLEVELVRRDHALRYLEQHHQELSTSLAITNHDLTQHQAWMQERNEQLNQLRQQAEDVTEKLQKAYLRAQAAERHADGLADQMATFRARPEIRLVDAWRSPWNRSAIHLMTRCLAQMTLPVVVRRLIKRSLSRSQFPPAIPTGAYRVRIPPAPLADAPVIVHAIANFWIGGSSRLVIDLIEGTGHRYHHHVLTSAVAIPAAYRGVEPDVMSGLPSIADIQALLVTRRATVLHLHYWGECDEPWYAACAQAAYRLGLPIIQNVNTPVAPLLDPPMIELVPVSTYVQAHFCAGRGTVIYPGSDFDSFSGNPDHASRQDSVGMVYRLEDDKLGSEAIAPFIELVRIRPSTRIYIIGGGSLLESFRRRVEAAEVAASFTFTGFVDYHILPDWYRRFGVFMAPVRKESFGQVSPFAMSMGIPVVGYDVGAIPEIIADPSLIAPAGDAVRLAQITADLLNDPQRRIAVGIAQQRHAHDKFSLSSMIDAYLRVYGRICTPSR